MQHRKSEGVLECQEVTREVNRQLLAPHKASLFISADNRKGNTLRHFLVAATKLKTSGDPFMHFKNTQVTDAEANCFEIKLACNRLLETLMSRRFQNLLYNNNNWRNPGNFLL